MTDGLFRLATWLSPSYPVGAYSYSHGLETAVADGNVTDAHATKVWICDCVQHGAGRTDVILLAHAWRAATDSEALAELADFARCLAPSTERLLETEAQGTAFSDVTAQAWPEAASPPYPYPVALGAAASTSAVPLQETAMMFLHAFAANLVSAAIRLVPLGQADGQRILADLKTQIQEVAKAAIHEPLDAVGGMALAVDIASMRHETQNVRLFRS